jgi:hypothetical protein
MDCTMHEGQTHWSTCFAFQFQLHNLQIHEHDYALSCHSFIAKSRLIYIGMIWCLPSLLQVAQLLTIKREREIEQGIGKREARKIEK